MYDKAREQGLRRRARENGLQLVSPFRFSGKAAHSSTYALVDPVRGTLMFGDPVTGYGMSLDAVEDYLTDFESASRRLSSEVEAHRPEDTKAAELV